MTAGEVQPALSPDFLGECALCRRRRRLMESHIMPKALYRLVRNPRSKNPHPVVAIPSRRGKSSFQVTSRLLCEECEGRFDHNGEAWVMRHCYRGRGVFRLREILRQSTPIAEDPEVLVYSASAFPAIDIGQLVYFCTSVFWRASVRESSIFGERFDPINLGNKYREELRRYLLGEDTFPDTATVSIFVSQLNRPLLTFSFPQSIRFKSRHTHRMHIPGITFVLTLGKELYSTWLKNCVFRSPLRPIYVSKLFDQTVQKDLGLAMGKSLSALSRYPLIDGDY